MKEEDLAQESDLVLKPVARPAEGARYRRPSRVFRHISAGPPRTRKVDFKDLALIIVFLAAITMPLAGQFLHLDCGIKLNDNRVLEPLPELKLDRASLAAFPAKFEAYFNDHFGFRQRLIHWLSVVKVLGLGVSSSRDVILGRNGWIFYGAFDL